MGLKIGFLGTGTIAAAMVRGLVRDGHDIWVSERNREISAELSTTYDNVSVSDNQSVVDNSDIVIVSLLADTAAEILPGLTFRPEQRALSVMVGIDHAAFGTLVAPAVGEAIFIPYPFIAQGNSPILVYPESDSLARLFGARNELIKLDSEGALSSYLAAQAILLPTVTQLHQTVSWLQERVGEGVSAETFIRLLVGGYLTAEPLTQPGVLGAAMRDLGTEGGLNAQLRDHFAAHGTGNMLTEGLDTLEKRLNAS